jgi:hypothetical protein
VVYLRSDTMSDDTSKRGGSDRSRININQDYERRDWANSLGVTEEELKEAVHNVGDRADKVREYLRHKPQRKGTHGTG